MAKRRMRNLRKARRTEEGITPVMFLIIIVAVLAGGYVLLQSGKLPISAPVLPGISLGTPRVTEAEFSFIDDPLIRKHFAAQANVTTYRTKAHDLIAQKGSLNVFEVQVRGEKDTAFYNWHESDGKKGGELIAIGDTTYIKDYKDGTWWKQTIKPEERPKNKDEGEREPADFKEEYTGLKVKPPKYEKLGEEACGSLTCYKYKEVDPQIAEASRIFWFDKGKLLLRREESGFGEWRATTEYEYDAINIRPPTPTKDVPAGHNIYEYMGTGAPIPSGAP